MIYLDNAATTYPKPNEVYENVMDAMKRYGANPGRGSHAMAIEGAKMIYDTREEIAELFNFDNPLNVIYTFNATDSLNLAIKGSLQPGDHVITTAMEHNSVLRPVFELQNNGITNTIVECNNDGTIELSNIEKAIKHNTKLIITTHVSNLTGTIMPIEEIGELCRYYGIPYLVDAAQSAGVLEIDMKKMNIDLLAFPGHKGLLGPQGTGGLLIRDGFKLKEIREGGTGSESSKLTQPDFYPDKFESGTLNLPGIAGLNAGVKYIKSKGTKSILSHENKLIELFINGIKNNDKIKIYGSKDISKRCGVIPLNIMGLDSSELAYILDSEYEIAVRPGLHCAPLAHKTIGTDKLGAVRFSVGPFNTESDINAAVNALNEITSKIL